MTISSPTEKMDNACLPKGCEAADRKSVFGKYEDSEMLSRLKALALNHCEPGLSRDSIRPLWDQTLRVRTFMALGDIEFARRKRKLQQFLKDEFKPPAGLASESSDKRSVTKLRRRQMSHGSSSSSSSSSCVLNKTADSSSESMRSRNVLKSHSSGSLLTLEDNFQRQFISSEFPILNNAKDSGPPSDGSVNGSNVVTPEHISLQESFALDDLVPSSNPLHEHLHTSRRSIRFLNSIGDHFQRMAIPVGPRFQADIPDWSGPPNKDGDSDSSKWLGTKVWPIEEQNVKSTAKSVGKGRSKSCFCVSRIHGLHQAPHS